MTICATIEKWTFAQVENDCRMRSVRKTLVAQVVIAHMVFYLFIYLFIVKTSPEGCVKRNKQKSNETQYQTKM
jgi:hypothetical protein